LEEYKELIDKFCELDINTKHKEIKNEIQELLGLFHKLCEDKNGNDSMLIHNKMKELDKDSIPEEEFLDGLYAYIISIKENIGKYLY